MATVSTEGDLGDAIILLGVLQSLHGGPHKLLTQPNGTTKFRTQEDCERLADLIRPLALKQDYISEVRVINPGERVDWASAEFRKAGFNRGETLMQAVVNNLIRVKQTGHGINGKDKWLHNIEPSKETEDRIVINRSGRWRNGTFPWGEIVKFYNWRLVFVGLEHEYREFCGHFGYVDFRPTSNMLEVAELIAGSLLFIGNQSSANAVCEGLKHNLIQETNLGIPDCIYKRHNAIHVENGHVILPGFGDEDMPTSAPKIDRRYVPTAKTPPGFWQYPFPKPTVVQQTFDVAINQMKANCPETKGMSDEDVRNLLIDATMDRLPDWGNSMKNRNNMVRIAKINAGY